MSIESMRLAALLICSIGGIWQLAGGNKYLGGFMLFTAGMNLSSLLGGVQ